MKLTEKIQQSTLVLEISVYLVYKKKCNTHYSYLMATLVLDILAAVCFSETQRYLFSPTEISVLIWSQFSSHSYSLHQESSSLCLNTLIYFLLS